MGRGDVPDYLKIKGVKLCSPEADFALYRNGALCIESCGEVGETLQIWRFADDTFVIAHADDVRETAIVLSGMIDYIMFGRYLGPWMQRIMELDRYHAFFEGYTPPPLRPPETYATN
jgi:hypothetical protein